MYFIYFKLWIIKFYIDLEHNNKKEIIMARNTKKAEREELAKARRKVRRKLSAHKAAKHGGSSKTRAKKSHPHRVTSALR